MSIPESFAGLPLDRGEAADDTSRRGSPPTGGSWSAPEGIDIKPLYTAGDLDTADALDTYPGLAPFLRGPYPTMYATRP